MMRHYRRLPAIIVLVVATATGVLYVRTWGQGRGAGQVAGGASLEELEKAIAGGENRPETWCAYAQRLTETSPPRFAQAALAYRKVLEKDPYHRQARVGCALALAQAGNADELHAFLRELIYSEPKLAVDLFDRPECRAYLAKERFVSLQKEARAQAMD